MPIPEIIRELEAERDRLSQAISALRKRRRHKPGARPVKGFMSQEVRKRISDAMKKKWAERRKSAQ